MITSFYMHLVLHFIIAFLVYSVCGKYELKQIQIVYRHGDRAPVKLYPTDKNKANNWRDGLGQLTEQGVRQQYYLGQWLRRRYEAFVGPQLKISDIHVRSSNMDRTLMSAEANLAGFVSNDSHQIIKGLPWQPIPIHTVREETDYLLELYSCARYTIEKDAMYQLEYFKKKFAPYKKRLEYLQKKTRLNNLSFSDCWIIYDDLYCEKVHNMTWDDWVTPEVWRDILAINKLNWEVLFYKHLAKLGGGLLLHRLISNMKNFSAHAAVNIPQHKIIMYSGHDTDVAPLAKLLGFFDNIQPPYASCLIFELYEDEGHQWAVKILYKNNSESEGAGKVYTQKVSGCSSTMCPWSEFLSLTMDKTLTRKQFLEACSVTTDFLFIIQILLFAVCIMLFVASFSLFIMRYRMKRSTIKYLPVDSKKCIN